MASITVTRDELYEKVWSIPMQKLASEYSLSDRGLAKLCARMNIPVPGRGYWRRLETGKKVTRKPLPEESKANTGTIYIKKPRERAIRESEFPVIPVPEKLLKPHPLIRESQQLLRTLSPSENGIVYPSGNQCLNIRVTKGSRKRALRIMDTVLKAFEERGYKVAIDDKWHTAVTVGEERVEFFIQERIITEELPGSDRWTKRYSYQATGELFLRIDTWTDMTRKTFSDGKKARVELLLGRFVSKAIDLGLYMQERTRVRKIEEEEYKRRRAAYELHKKRCEFLEKQSAKFEEQQKLCSYVSAFESSLTPESSKDALDWLEWMKLYVGSLESFPVPTAEDLRVWVSW